MERRKFLELSTMSTLGMLASGSMISTLTGCTPDVGTAMRMQSSWVNDAEFIGYFVGIEKGYYKDAGIDFKYLPGGPEIVSDSVLMVGNAEIALTTPDVTINAIVKRKLPFKIIGAQYQKSPLGIVSLEKNNIKMPKDLIGKTLAVPPANQITAEAFLKINNISSKDVKIVPYQYDPTPLLNNEVDATIDFVTNVPFTIKEKGGVPTSFLLYDYGFQLFNDTVVVLEKTLDKHRDQLSAWLKASKKAWEENLKDPALYPAQFMTSYFKGTGRTKENEIFYNNAQKALIESPNGLFSMSEESINANIKSLQAVGIDAKRDMFVNDLI